MDPRIKRHPLKTVLVTGASGFIGRATVTCLQNAGWRVTCAVRSAKSFEHDQIHLDLNDPAGILALESSHRFDAIVHLGASIGWSGAAESEMYVPNALATGCLAFLTRQWNARLIYASAAIVCGVKTEKIDLRTPALPDTAYAKSKYLGEQLIESSCVPHCILRIGGVFGVNGPAHLGLNRAVDGALKGLAPTQIGEAGQLRNYIYVKDVAQAILFALNSRLQGTHFLAGSEAISVNQMLKEICDTFLPGLRPTHQDGAESMCQVILPSLELPKTRSFSEALSDIKATNS